MQVRRGRAICAAALAIVLAACTLISGWHQATVLHARCALHGELYHVAAADPSRAKLGEHRLAARDGDAGDEHDHCQMCPRAHEGAPAQASVVRVAMPPVASAPLPAPRVVAIALADTYRDAPKTSPPVNEVSSVW